MEEAKHEAEAIVSQARARAQSEREELQRHLEATERAFVERISQTVAAAAGEAVLSQLERLQGAELDAVLVGVACRGIAASGAPRGRVVVETARPLSPALHEQLALALGAARTTAEFVVRPDLGAGVRVFSDAGLVDASARGMAEHARRRLAEAVAHA